MQASLELARPRQPVAPPASDWEDPDVLGAARHRQPARRNGRALRDALRQWMLITGVIGAGLLALVLTLKA